MSQTLIFLTVIAIGAPFAAALTFQMKSAAIPVRVRARARRPNCR